jgi:hypothetical protein
MAFPGFTATDSCYRRSRFCTAGRAAGSSSRARRTVSPSEVICDESHVCTCECLDNCIGMFGTQVAACDSTDGLICGCLQA